jgi:hypothetical protein
MSQQQALKSAFPNAARVERQTFFLTPEQLKVIKQKSGAEEAGQLVIRYVGRNASGAILGYAYFDAHRVRTLPETIMVVVTPAGVIDHVDILSFNEPTDYLPKRRWLDQLRTRKLDDELAVNRAIRPISGATLSGRAIVVASRKVLAIHSIVGGAAPAAR